jgi:hypothetical protein
VPTSAPCGSSSRCPFAAAVGERRHREGHVVGLAEDREAMLDGDRRVRALDHEIGVAAFHVRKVGKSQCLWDFGQLVGRAVPHEGDLEAGVSLRRDGAIESLADEAEADETDALHAACQLRRLREIAAVAPSLIAMPKRTDKDRARTGRIEKAMAPVLRASLAAASRLLDSQNRRRAFPRPASGYEIHRSLTDQARDDPLLIPPPSSGRMDACPPWFAHRRSSTPSVFLLPPPARGRNEVGVNSTISPLAGEEMPSADVCIP